MPWDDAVVSALALHAVVLTNALLLGAVATVTNPAPRAIEKMGAAAAGGWTRDCEPVSSQTDMLKRIFGPA